MSGDCIPIEWIKQWIASIEQNSRYSGQIHGEIKYIVYGDNRVVIHVPCVSDMLEDWEKEQNEL